MSRSGVDQAVETIRDDKELAQRVFADGPPALSSFDLSGEESEAIVDALPQDVEEAQGEVSGFAVDMFAPASLNNLMGVGRSLGGGGGAGKVGQAGWIDKGWIDITSSQEL
jgi:hypothetical protein